MAQLLIEDLSGPDAENPMQWGRGQVETDLQQRVALAKRPWPPRFRVVAEVQPLPRMIATDVDLNNTTGHAAEAAAEDKEAAMANTIPARAGPCCTRVSGHFARCSGSRWQRCRRALRPRVILASADDLATHWRRDAWMAAEPNLAVTVGYG